MKRTIIKETLSEKNKEVLIKGWVDTRRDHGKIVFLDLRDRSGIIQVVCAPENAKDIKEEYVLEIKGKIKERPEKMINPEIETGKIEIEAKEIKIIAESESLPFDIKEGINLSLPILLDNRALTLRNEKIKAIFKIKEETISSFRNTLKEMDFTEFQAPTIVPTATEGGSEVFRIDYYGHDAYLAQSPQLYKQILVGVFERVFTVTHAFRAEPSITTRHLSEYISLDAEMGFLDSWTDLMDIVEIVIKNIFKDLEEKCEKELELFDAKMPKIGTKIPRIKMREAQEIIFKRTKRDNRKKPDLEPEDEKEIIEWAEKEHNSELIFITHYPTKKRPFYTYQDPENKEYTLSFDVLLRGLEIVTGGQRINDYKQLLKNIDEWGNKKEDFQLYLQAFQYGMPEEGGFALGAERIVKQILNLSNLREASIFPRDMGRIDHRLKQNDKKH